MGYAKLNFATSVTTGQAMYDIVRIINGTITSTASLSYASTTNSEIVNTRGENWTVLYGSIDPATAAYVLTSPCVTASKTHYCRILGGSGSSWNVSATFATGGTGIAVNTITGATNNTTVSNPTFYSTNGAAVNPEWTVKVDANNVNIYVHWSARHLLFYGKTGYTTASTMVIGSFQYPETSLTQFTNTPPVLQFTNRYTSDGSQNVITVLAPGTANGAVASAVVFQGVQVHEPQASTTSGVYNLAGSGLGTVLWNDFDPVPTLNSSGASTYPLLPIYWMIPERGIPTINISELSGFYRMAKSAAVPESVFTVGADSYVWLPISTTITGGTQQAGIALLKK